MGVVENGGLLGIPLSTFEIGYSSKHNGLAMYISRIVRSLWNRNLVIQKDKKLELNFTISELVNVQHHLESLDQFLKQYKSFTAPPSPDARPTGVDPEAWRTEQESLMCLHLLLRHTIETLSFLTLLIDYRFSVLVSR